MSSDNTTQLSSKSIESIESINMQHSVDTSLAKGSRSISQQQSEVSQSLVVKRHCTDLLCSFLLLFFVFGWIIFPLFAYSKIGLSHFLKPTDSYGNICGNADGEFANRPYLYFFNLVKCALELQNSVIDGCSTPQLCVAHCPNVTFAIHELHSIDDDNITQKWLDNVICKYDSEKPTKKNIELLVEKEQCAGIYLHSEPLFDRCIPSILNLDNGSVVDDFENQPIKDINGTNIDWNSISKTSKILNLWLTTSSILDNIVSDLYQTWKWIFIVLIFGTLLSAVWVLNLHHFVRVTVWVAFVAIILMLGFLVIFFIQRYYSLQETTNDIRKYTVISNGTESTTTTTATFAHPVKVSNTEHQSRTSMMKQTEHAVYYFSDALRNEINQKLYSPQLWLFLAIVFSIVIVALLAIICVLTRQINIAIKLIEEASLALSTIRCGLCVPLVPHVFKLSLTIIWLLFVTIIINLHRKHYMTSEGEQCVPVKPDDTKCTLQPFISKEQFIYVQLYNLFVYLWLYSFIDGLYFMTLAGSYSTFYWTNDKENLPYCSLLNSTMTTLRYHTGTVAFGSAIITVLSMIRLVVQFLYSTVKKITNSKNEMIQSLTWLMKCCMCCHCMLEKLVGYINYNSYIMCAIYGKSFCVSANKAFELIISNPLRALVLNSITDFILLCFRLTIAFFTGFVAYSIFSNNFPNLYYVWTPVVVSVIITNMVASLYISVYQIGVDTMFLCFLLDQKLNDGTSSKPFLIPSRVHRFFNKRSESKDSVE